jgi:hypothetical protein
VGSAGINECGTATIYDEVTGVHHGADIFGVDRRYSVRVIRNPGFALHPLLLDGVLIVQSEIQQVNLAAAIAATRDLLVGTAPITGMAS